jgi:DNA-binding FadR family transcriptional regulator
MSYYDIIGILADWQEANISIRRPRDLVMTTAQNATPRKRQRLAQTLIDHVRTQIESGALAVGDQLPTEQQLEADFGVSRTVVREAIADLRASGFVSPVQGKGVFVNEPPPSERLTLTSVELRGIPETLELLELRLAIEVEGAGIAAYRRSAEQEAQIRLANQRMGRLIDSGEGTVEADFAFHMAVAAATNNRYYLEVLGHFGPKAIPRGQFPRLPQVTDPAYLSRVHDEHAAILDAISDQDPDRARASMRAHLMASQKRYRRLAEQDE